MWVKTCKIFYQKSKCKIFYKNLTASHSILSPFLILYSSSLTLAQTNNNTHWHTTLHLHSAGTLHHLHFHLVEPPSDFRLFCHWRSRCERPEVSLITAAPLLVGWIWFWKLQTPLLRSLIWNRWEWVGFLFLHDLGFWDGLGVVVGGWVGLWVVVVGRVAVAGWL